MSEENVEVVRRVYETLARSEPLGPDLLDPDVEYVNPPTAVEPGIRRGAAAFVEAVQAVYEGWSEWNMEPEEFTAIGDHVAVVVGYRARGSQSGVEMEGRESALFTLRDGRVVRYAWFSEPGEALAAAESGA